MLTVRGAVPVVGATVTVCAQKVWSYQQEITEFFLENSGSSRTALEQHLLRMTINKTPLLCARELY